VAEPVGTGQMGVCARLDIAYRGDAAGLPTSLVAKLPAADPAARALVAGAYRTEVAFYRHLAPTLAVRAPACHFSAVADEGANFVLLLEDVAPARQGDQLTGCAPDEALSAVENLAGLHGPRWCDPTLVEETGLTEIDAESVSTLAAVTADATERFTARFEGELGDDDREVLRRLPAVVEHWMLARRERFAPVHGDYRLDNVLFHPEGTDTVAVDWQTLGLGLPGRDLAYFVGTSLDPDDRQAHEQELVAAYHRALQGHGVSGYTLDECWDDYCYGALQGPLITVLGCAYGARTERGDRMFLAMVRRSCAAVRDLATYDLL
jgi:hypothetical protein